MDPISHFSSLCLSLILYKIFFLLAFFFFFLNDPATPEISPLPLHNPLPIFDKSSALPSSNDMWPNHPEANPGTSPPLTLIDNDRVVIPNVTHEDQAQLTTWYTERAVKFI